MLNHHPDSQIASELGNMSDDESNKELQQANMLLKKQNDALQKQLTELAAAVAQLQAQPSNSHKAAAGSLKGPDPFQSDPPQNPEVMATATRSKLPDFDAAEVDIWFILIESAFDNDGVRSERTKYNRTIQALPAKFLKSILPFVDTKPLDREAPYQALKEEIKNKAADSVQTQLDNLTSQMRLTPGLKPSQLLRDMRSVAMDNVSEKYLETLWLARLPTLATAVVTGLKVPLGEKGEIADDVVEKIRASQQTGAVDTVNPSVESAAVARGDDKLAAVLERMSKQLDRLAQGTRGRSVSRDKGRLAPRTRTPSAASKVCFFHRKYGKEARRCREGCTYDVPKN